MVYASPLTLVYGIFTIQSVVNSISSHGNCTCEHADGSACLQFRCTGSNCGDLSFSDDFTCLCESVMPEKNGCQALMISGNDMECETRDCMQLYPYICSDYYNNFQIYPNENGRWADAVRTCEQRNMQLATYNFSRIYYNRDINLWTGVFYGFIPNKYVYLPRNRILKSNINNKLTFMKCVLQPRMVSNVTHSHSSTVNLSPTSCGGLESTTTNSPAYWTTEVTTNTSLSSEDKGSSHGNVASIVVPTLVVCIVVVLVAVFVWRFRKSKKRNNRNTQQSHVGDFSRSENKLTERNPGRIVRAQIPVSHDQSFCDITRGRGAMENTSEHENNGYDINSIIELDDNTSDHVLDRSAQVVIPKQ